MNEQVLKQILDKLSSIESRLAVIENEHEAQHVDSGRFWDGVKRFGSPLTPEQFEIIRNASPASSLTPERRTGGIFEGFHGYGYQPFP